MIWQKSYSETKSCKKVEKKIVIITDGGLTMGLGHVYRTLSLAKRLSKFSKIKFLTQSGDIVVGKIKNSGYKVSNVDNTNGMKRWLSFDKPDIIVIDKLEVNERFAKYIKTNLNARLIIFGNISSTNKYADVVINAIIGTNYKNKSFIDKNTGTLYLEGPKYLVLRREFYEHKNLYKFRNNLKKILLIFGGSDQANLTSKVLDKLLSINHNFKVDIVLGPAFKFDKELGKILKNHRSKKNSVETYKDVNNVSELMLNSDLIITSPGTTMYEACYLGVPAIALCQNQYQIDMHRSFKLAYDFNKIKNFEEFILNFNQNYINNKKYLRRMQFGEGKEEIIKSIIGGKE